MNNQSGGDSFPPTREGFLRVREGSVFMDYDEKEAVFYNKVQEFNRDISVQVIRLFAEQREAEKAAKFAKRQHAWEVDAGRAYDTSLNLENVKRLTKSQSEPTSNTFGVSIPCYHDASNPKAKEIRQPFAEPKGIHILDALAATGLRSVRYMKEIPLVRKVTVNDIIPEAREAQKENCYKNDFTNDKMPTGLNTFDVVDLDPYGTAAPFLDSAVQAVSHGGLLNVTCTDMAVLSGNFPEKCFSLYGTVGLKSKFYHEASLRTLLHAVDSAANKHGRYIIPWLSLSVDFYIRVFVRVFDSPKEVKSSLLRRSLVHQSTHSPNVCPETGSALRVGGPFWSGALHDQNVVDELLRRVSLGDMGTSRRIQAVLASISEELKDVLFYYNIPELAANLHSTAPTKTMLRNALNNAGYRFSHFHHEPSSLKTDAPPQVIWDIMRQYCLENPPEGSKHKKQSEAAKSILGKDIKTEVNWIFDPKNPIYASKQGIDNIPDNRNKKARFPVNPERDWGPKRKALGKGTEKMSVSDNDDENENDETTHSRKKTKSGGHKGKGKEYYMQLNAEKAEKIRAERALSRGDESRRSQDE
eukprot:GSChrysophyteH1.ASY1.ANO1.2920.1 assembled CDS